MIDKMEIDEGNELWKKLGPYSSQLNVDEVDDIDSTWKSIAELIDEDLNTIKNTIQTIRDLFIVLDHCR